MLQLCKFGLAVFVNSALPESDVRIFWEIHRVHHVIFSNMSFNQIHSRSTEVSRSFAVAFNVIQKQANVIPQILYSDSSVVYDLITVIHSSKKTGSQHNSDKRTTCPFGSSRAGEKLIDEVALSLQAQVLRSAVNLTVWGVGWGCIKCLQVTADLW